MILFLDVFSGISGDMTLGAFVDLGVPADWIQRKLQSLFGGFRIRTETVFRNHLRAINLFVDVESDQSHRHYSDIKALISEADLPDSVKANSLAAFEKIARAESFIHGKEVDHVHFHEVGGIDSMVDIMGSFLCADYLGIDRVIASRIPLGSGFVECAHGRIPVPVPAVTAILKDIPVTGSDATTEIVTPTGAAIVAVLSDSFGPMPDMRIEKIGYGSGKRKTGSALPNLLRMVLGTQEKADGAKKQGPGESVYVVNTNVDDTSPEILGFLMDLLMDQGALDVSYIPVHMKKNRPGTKIEVLVSPLNLGRVTDTILAQTSTIGLRYHRCERRVLERQTVFRDTGFGPIQVKKITGGDGGVTLVPEYEAARQVALKKNIPLKDVYARISAELNSNEINHVDPNGQD